MWWQGWTTPDQVRERNMKKEPMMPAEERLVTELAWRGPQGRPMGVVVLSREQAEEVLKTLADLRGQIEELKKGGPT